MTKNHWQPFNSLQHADLKANWQSWLLHSQSFMRKLIEAKQKSAIQVLQQAWRLPSKEDADLLNIPNRKLALIREVLIGNKNGNWMYAKTIFPQETITGQEQPLARLGNRSLGTLLFKNKKVQRSEFEIAKLNKSNHYYQEICKRIPLADETIWARRSQFYIQQKTLLLVEIFLPDIKKIIEAT